MPAAMTEEICSVVVRFETIVIISSSTTMLEPVLPKSLSSDERRAEVVLLREHRPQAARHVVRRLGRELLERAGRPERRPLTPLRGERPVDRGSPSRRSRPRRCTRRSASACSLRSARGARGEPRPGHATRHGGCRQRRRRRRTAGSRRRARRRDRPADSTGRGRRRRRRSRAAPRPSATGAAPAGLESAFFGLSQTRPSASVCSISMPFGLHAGLHLAEDRQRVLARGHLRHGDEAILVIEPARVRPEPRRTRRRPSAERTSGRA